MFSFVCSECGHHEYTSKGFNANRTKKRLVCKNCGKNVYIDIDVFEGAVSVNSVDVTSPEIKTVDLVNERTEDREPFVSKTRILCINGQTGAFPDYTEKMVEAYATSQNHSLEYKDGIYYLTARPGSKGC